MLFSAEPAAFLTETRLSLPDLSTVQPDSGIPLDSGEKFGPYVIKPTFCNLKNSSPADSNRTRGAVYSPQIVAMLLLRFVPAPTSKRRSLQSPTLSGQTPADSRADTSLEFFFFFW